MELKELREKLLDLGKRNKLLNFDESSSKTIEIISPEITALFNKITNGQLCEIINSDFVYKNETLGTLNKEDFINLVDKKNNSNKILMYKKDALINKALLGIKQKYKENLEEKGINVLYAAFGNVLWNDSKNDNFNYVSPLVLIPINIRNESLFSPYFIEEFDDSIIVNPALKYKFKNDYSIDLPDINDANISEYIDKITELVKPLNWTTTKKVFISFFSFSKVDMYMDIKTHEDLIMNNENVRRLLGEETKVRVQQDKEVNIDQANLHNVVNADSSQEEAIIQIKKGNSFVLQGPPGTGKSQTITNLIAECLYDGKKVLFVSEKLAALNIVYNNLSKVGLEDFLLQLHSDKTAKKDVINELIRVLGMQKSSLSEKANGDILELNKARNNLNQYCLALHTKRPVIERTLFDLYNEMSALMDTADIQYVIKNIDKKDMKYYAMVDDLLSKYVTYTKTIGSDYRKNEWNGFVPDVLSFAEKIRLEKTLKDASEVMTYIHTILRDLKEKVLLEPNSISELIAIKQYTLFASNFKNFDSRYYKIKSLNKAIKELSAAKLLQEQILERISKLSNIYKKEIYDLDITDIAKRYKNEYNSFFCFLKKTYSSDNKIISSYFVNGIKKPSKIEVSNNLVEIEATQNLIKEYRNGKELVSTYLNEDYNDLSTNYDSLLSSLDQIHKFIEKGINLEPLAQLTKKDYLAYKPIYKEMTKRITEIEKYKKSSFDVLQEFFDSSDFNMPLMPVLDVSNRIEKCRLSLSMIDNYLSFKKVVQELKKLDVLDYIHFNIDINTDTTEYQKIYRKLFVSQWVYYILNTDKVLKNFSSPIQDKNVEIFKEKDLLTFKIALAEIKMKISSKRPNTDVITNGSPVSVLLREGQKKRKQMPIRMLFKEISDLVQNLKPCFLMSPLSVSSLLEPNGIDFDVVIFDEASQIFPQDAIGSIYRAKQIIIVGDSQQMPPSNFFMSESSEEVDNEDYSESISDYESILDLAAIRFPQYRLSWHYRSKIEALISFSNRNYYNGSLISFPSAQNVGKDLGVEYYHVENGLFNRTTKTNILEANYVADLVFKHFKEYPERSLGVVAFSASQQELIETIINSRREKNSQLEYFFRSDLREPLFIKNLETVQGDERDTIIFSIAYGYDDKGKFYHNFGPLNRVGGERRLNVAITRAKINVKVVTSIHAFDIDMSKTSALGAKLLKEYIDYAENGIILAKNKSNDEEMNHHDFVNEVGKTLKNKGYEVEIGYGDSIHKIDLAIRHPKTHDFALAIECDGDTYFNNRSTRDRDRLRSEVLEKLGWKYYRIWSTEWIKNKKNSIKQLFEVVDAALKELESKDAAMVNVIEPKVEKKEVYLDVMAKKPIFTNYVHVDMSSITSSHMQFSDMIAKILEIEAPISKDALTEIVYFGCKITSNIRSSFATRISVIANEISLIEKDNFFYVNNNELYDLRVPGEVDNAKREISRIAKEELAGGLLTVIKENGGMVQKQGLFQYIAQVIGYSRLSESVSTRLDMALSYLVQLGHVEIFDQDIRIINF